MILYRISLCCENYLFVGVLCSIQQVWVHTVILCFSRGHVSFHFIHIIIINYYLLSPCIVFYRAGSILQFYASLGNVSPFTSSILLLLLLFIYLLVPCVLCCIVGSTLQLYASQGDMSLFTSSTLLFLLLLFLCWSLVFYPAGLGSHCSSMLLQGTCLLSNQIWLL